jgi:dTDP-glucose 4,6-dehydratase
VKALITGGCGFIGSHVVRAFLADGWSVTNLDKLTYAADLANLGEAFESPGYRFVQGDICDQELTRELVAGTDIVLNFAAETHVDRSLVDPAVFARTDVEGVVSLLEAVRADGRALLVQMSTDEVFGSLREPVEADEEFVLRPTSPYSASKAGAELMLTAYSESYGMPVTILRCCNVYGPNQHLEKFIPLFITRALAGEPLPLYGDGLQEREWIFVEDVVAAVRHIVRRPMEHGLQRWNIGSGHRVTNNRVARLICEFTERPTSLIQHVTDRPGHDRRYAIDAAKLRATDWAPGVEFADGLARTVAWFQRQRATQPDAAFEEWMRIQYGQRLGPARG